MLMRQSSPKFGDDTAAACRGRIEMADTRTLLERSAQIPAADKIDEIFQ